MPIKLPPRPPELPKPPRKPPEVQYGRPTTKAKATAEAPKNPFMKTISLYKYTPDEKDINQGLWGNPDGPLFARKKDGDRAV